MLEPQQIQLGLLLAGLLVGGLSMACVALIAAYVYRGAKLVEQHSEAMWVDDNLVENLKRCQEQLDELQEAVEALEPVSKLPVPKVQEDVVIERILRRLLPGTELRLVLSCTSASQPVFTAQAYVQGAEVTAEQLPGDSPSDVIRRILLLAAKRRLRSVEEDQSVCPVSPSVCPGSCCSAWASCTAGLCCGIRRVGSDRRRPCWRPYRRPSQPPSPWCLPCRLGDSRSRMWPIWSVGCCPGSGSSRSTWNAGQAPCTCMTW